MKKFATLALTAVAGLGLSSASFAVPTTYFGEDTSTAGVLGPNSAAARADFLSRLIGVGNEDFEGFATGTTSPLALSFPGSTGTLGATLTGTGQVDNENTFGNPGRFATSGTQFWEVTTGSFRIEFADPIAAFGFNGIDIGDFVTAQMTLELTNGTTETLTVPHSLNIGNSAQATLFFGFIDESNSYSSIEFTNAGGGDLFAFDDMVIGDLEQIVPAPAPGTVALFGLGLLGLFGAARRRRG
jgi:hypothetical protein